MILWNTQSIFIRVPKTASTSILYSLLDCSEKCSAQEFNKIFDRLKPEFLHKNFNGDPHHVSYQTLKNHTPEKDRQTIDGYFKFSFVRNPFDRAISIYKYVLQQESAKCRENFTLSKTFKDFVKTNLASNPNNNKEDIWFSDQYTQVQGCDFIGRFESLQADFDLICNKLGIKRKPLPQKNTTKHKHYTEYYDDETLEIVSKKYSADIKRFGYKFGD